MANEGPTRPLVCFDIGATLGRPRLSAPPPRLLGIDVYPYVPAVLDELTRRDVRLGIVSNTGTETIESMREHLEQARLYEYFDDDLLVYSSVVGMRKDSPAIFELTAERAGLASSPEQCVYVGEDNVERDHALAAGWRAAPHPLLAVSVLDGDQLQFVRIEIPDEHAAGPWRDVLRRLPLVPLAGYGTDATVLHAIVARSAIAAIANAGLPVQPLGRIGAPASCDLYLLRDDQARSSGLRADVGQAGRFSGDDQAGLLVAASEKGLTVELPPDRSIEEFHFDGAAHGHNVKLSPDPGLLTVAELRRPSLAERDLTADEAAIVGQLTPAVFGAHVARYSGDAPLGPPPATPLDSRHIHHGDNQRAVDALATDLAGIGGGAFDVSVHTFTHQGVTHANVAAELAGSTDKLVLVTAHLDSTAASSPPYDASTDPAPGADDDASGIAAVLCAAEVIRELAAANQPSRTIRFVLFNAEEHGLIGSHAYARDALAAGDDIEAVFQMDMIGYNVAPPATFELHAGFQGSATVQDGSAVLAARVARLAPAVSPALGASQVYLSTAADPDPAEGRSDHAAFHLRGYPAIATTEDFFAGPGSAASEPNPNYHQAADTFVDTTYGAGIARAVVAAAWTSASPDGAPTGHR